MIENNALWPQNSHLISLKKAAPAKLLSDENKKWLSQSSAELKLAKTVPRGRPAVVCVCETERAHQFCVKLTRRLGPEFPDIYNRNQYFEDFEDF